MKFIIVLLSSLAFSASAFSAPEKASPGHPHLFILSGQSNMTKALADSFTEAVNAALGKENVAVIMFGRPGQPIRNWDKDWTAPEGFEAKAGAEYGIFYPQVMAGAEKALKGRKPATATLVWMQGEQDADGTAATYEKSFHNLLARMKADLGMDEMRFVVGRINDFWLVRPQGKEMREILVKIAEDDPNGDWIDTDDLNRGVNPWGGFSFSDGHYPPTGYVDMGKRFAQKAISLVAPDANPGPAIFAERFIDSHTQIGSHAALGKPIAVRGVEMDAGSQAKLLDGKFGKPDHDGSEWEEIPPTEGTVTLTVDLGEAMDLETAGVNFLVDSKAAFPAAVTFSHSVDGKDFLLSHGKHNRVQMPKQRKLDQLKDVVDGPDSVLVLTSQLTSSGPAHARYVRIEIKPGNEWLYLDEVVVNPVKGGAGK